MFGVAPHQLVQGRQRCTRAADGAYASRSDCLRDLVRQDQRRRAALARLQADIDLGRSAGKSDRDLKQIIAELGKADMD